MFSVRILERRIYRTSQLSKHKQDAGDNERDIGNLEQRYIWEAKLGLEENWDIENWTARNGWWDRLCCFNQVKKKLVSFSQLETKLWRREKYTKLQRHHQSELVAIVVGAPCMYPAEEESVPYKTSFSPRSGEFCNDHLICSKTKKHNNQENLELNRASM